MSIQAFYIYLQKKDSVYQGLKKEVRFNVCFNL